MTPEPDDSARYWTETYDRRHQAGSAPPAPAPAQYRPAATLAALAIWVSLIAVQWPRTGAATLLILPVVVVHAAYVFQGGRLRDAPVDAFVHFWRRFR